MSQEQAEGGGWRAPKLSDRMTTVQCKICAQSMSVKSNVTRRVCSPSCLLSDRSQLESNGCKVWTGPTDRDGYGIAYIDGKYVSTHRLAYTLALGSIPSGAMVRHTCDNPPCIDPDHLLVGTAQDNSNDCVERDRQSKGSQVASSILKEADIPIIRGSKLTKRQLAEQYGVSIDTIKQVRSRKTWKHVE